MNLKHVEAFYWLCQLTSYRRVAERLNLTQPAVSSRIVALEVAVGAALVDRTQRRFTLTERGHEVLVQCERMLDLRDRMLRGGGRGDGPPRIRIAAVSLTARHWMPDLLRRAAAAFPDTRVELTTASDDQLARYMPTADVDLAFLSNAPARAEIPHPFTVGYDVRWIARRDLAPPGSGPFDAGDLSDLPLLLYPRTSPLYALTEAMGQDGSAPRHSANSLGTLVWMLEQGMGVAAIPAAAVADALERGDLTVLNVTPAPRILKVRCSYLNLARRARAEALLDLAFHSARDACDRDPRWMTFIEGE